MNTQRKAQTDCQVLLARGALLLLLLFASPILLAGGDATVPGTITTPFPTLNSLTVEWAITGDANLNGVVALRYRRSGTLSWANALPLRRVPADGNEGFSWSNRHSGSVFDLLPATGYELELSLSDPDGGAQQSVVTVATRAPPTTTPGGVIRAATPTTLAAQLNAAQPGDIVELGAGNYSAFTVPNGGAPGQPIVLRGLAGAVINGEVGLFSRDHVVLHGLSVNGRIRFNGSDSVGVIGCTINTTGDGIVNFLRAENAYIADNVINGATVWAESSLGDGGNNIGEGIVVTGPGHVIVRNQVRGFRDGISFMEGASAVDQYSIDVLDNQISVAADDGIEADFCFHNCRILRNRLTNVFIALSAQPSLGGPTYFIRNSAYNVVHIPFKLYRGSIGDVVLHNTIVKNGDPLNAYPGRPIARAYFRNNLLLGGAPATYNGYSSGASRIIDLQTLVTANSSLDYDGYGTTLATFTGRIGAIAFNSLIELQSLTSESHARQVDMNVFAAPVLFPAAAMSEFAAPDLRIGLASAAVDVAQPLPNINDGYFGAAPDLGAFEAIADVIFANGFD